MGQKFGGTSIPKKLKKIQTKFCKRYVGLRQNTADNFVLGECGRFPLAVAYMVQPIKYWIKLTQMQNHRYPRQCYLMLRSLTDAGKTAWTTHVKSLLFEHGFGYVWIADAVGNTNPFLSIFTQRFKDISLQNWRSSINNSPKADHFNTSISSHNLK